MTFINKRTHEHIAIFHEALKKNIKGTYMNMNTDKAIMLCQWKNNKFSKQSIDKHVKYQRRSLNIIILNVRSNVLLSNIIAVV